LCPTHIVLCYLSCLSSSCVLCMVVSNTYSVVLFVLFVVVLCLVYGCVQLYSVVLFVLFVVVCVLCVVVSNSYRQTRQITQHYMCWTQPYTRHRTTTNKTNNTTLYVLDTTIHKTQDDDKQDK
jgi:Ca2+/Na+ antiporter